MSLNYNKIEDVIALFCNNYDLAIESEKNKAKKYSPGIVEDQEVVARCAYSPDQIDTTTYTPTTLFFDDLFSRGLSVFRLSHIDDVGQIHQFAKAKELNDNLQRQQPINYEGYFVGAVEEIRKILLPSKKRGCGIYDTASKTKVYHADVLPFANDETAQMVLRFELSIVFSKTLLSKPR